MLTLQNEILYVTSVSINITLNENTPYLYCKKTTKTHKLKYRSICRAIKPITKTQACNIALYYMVG